MHKTNDNVFCALSGDVLNSTDVKSTSDDELFGPSRLPPKVCLRDKMRFDVRTKEINDLLTPGEMEFAR